MKQASDPAAHDSRGICIQGDQPSHEACNLISVCIFGRQAKRKRAPDCHARPAAFRKRSKKALGTGRRRKQAESPAAHGTSYAAVEIEVIGAAEPRRNISTSGDPLANELHVQEDVIGLEEPVLNDSCPDQARILDTRQSQQRPPLAAPWQAKPRARPRKTGKIKKSANTTADSRALEPVRPVQKSSKSSKPAELLTIPKESKKSSLIDWSKPAKSNKRQKLMEPEPLHLLPLSGGATSHTHPPPERPATRRICTADHPASSPDLNQLPNALLQPFWPGPQSLGCLTRIPHPYASASLSPPAAWDPACAPADRASSSLAAVASMCSNIAEPPEHSASEDALAKESALSINNDQLLADQPSVLASQCTQHSQVRHTSRTAAEVETAAQGLAALLQEPQPLLSAVMYAFQHAICACCAVFPDTAAAARCLTPEAHNTPLLAEPRSDDPGLHVSEGVSPVQVATPVQVQPEWMGEPEQQPPVLPANHLSICSEGVRREDPMHCGQPESLSGCSSKLAQAYQDMSQPASGLRESSSKGEGAPDVPGDIGQQGPARNSLPVLEDLAATHPLVPEQHQLAALWLSRTALSRFSLSLLLHVACQVDHLLVTSAHTASVEQHVSLAAHPQQAPGGGTISDQGPKHHLCIEGGFLKQLRAHLHRKALHHLALAASARFSCAPAPPAPATSKPAPAAAEKGAHASQHGRASISPENAASPALSCREQAKPGHDESPHGPGSPPAGEPASGSDTAGPTALHPLPAAAHPDYARTVADQTQPANPPAADTPAADQRTAASVAMKICPQPYQPQSGPGGVLHPSVAVAGMVGADEAVHPGRTAMPNLAGPPDAAVRASFQNAEGYCTLDSPIHIAMNAQYAAAMCLSSGSLCRMTGAQKVGDTPWSHFFQCMLKGLQQPAASSQEHSPLS